MLALQYHKYPLSISVRGESKGKQERENLSVSVHIPLTPLKDPLMAGETIAELASLRNSPLAGHPRGLAHMGCLAVVHSHRFTSHQSDGPSTVLHFKRGQCT